jgi:hypothetical protein
MRASKLLALALSAGLGLSAGTALAASDYLLEFDGIDGESAAKDHKQTIEISSFSWGASNPTSVGSSGMGAGKASMQDVSVQTAPTASSGDATPPAEGSGLATGRRMHKPLRADPGSTNVTAPADGSTGQLTVRLRESPTRASMGRSGTCAAGKHIAKATLRSQTEAIELHDATVTSCDAQGQDMVMVLTGTAKHTKSGHVTLMK